MDMLKFQYMHRVTYAECTVGNHIYYARYLDLLETARGEFLRSLGTTFQQWQDQDAIFPVMECRLKYHCPARYDDLLKIELWVTQAERVRLAFAGRMYNQDAKLIIEGETRHACTTVEGKPRRLPEALSQAVLPYLHSSG